MDEKKKLDEKTLESVTGGDIHFVKPFYDPYDPSDDTPHCPVCGGEVSISGDVATCLECGRQFPVDELP